MTGPFKTWVAIEQLGVWVCAVNTLLWDICKMCDTQCHS